MDPRRSLVVMVGLLWVVAAGVACGQQDGKGDQEPRPMQQKKIETVLKEHTDSLMAVPGVVGTAIGECAGKPCIKVLQLMGTRLPSKRPGRSGRSTPANFVLRQKVN
jgi:hypothetical protein